MLHLLSYSLTLYHEYSCYWLGRKGTCPGLEAGPIVLVENLYVGPGNPGTSSLTLTNGRQVENVALSPKGFQFLRTVLIRYQIDMMVVGPEEPLVL
jgi:hypothetical protein